MNGRAVSKQAYPRSELRPRSQPDADPTAGVAVMGGAKQAARAVRKKADVAREA